MDQIVRLRDVPDQFLDSAKWGAVQTFARHNKLTALTYLNALYPDPNCDFIWNLDGTDANLQNCIEIYSIGRSLLSQCRSLFNSGVLTAVSVDNGEKIPIPQKRWFEFYPMFATDRVSGRDVMFNGVQVLESQSFITPSESLLLECIGKLKEFRIKGKRSKKVLWYEVSTCFGPRFTRRLYDTAYKAVFDSPRGHPLSNELQQ
jgi:hypothetical protein